VLGHGSALSVYVTVVRVHGECCVSVWECCVSVWQCCVSVWECCSNVRACCVSE